MYIWTNACLSHFSCDITRWGFFVCTVHVFLSLCHAPEYFLVGECDLISDGVLILGRRCYNSLVSRIMNPLHIQVEHGLIADEASSGVPRPSKTSVSSDSDLNTEKEYGGAGTIRTRLDTVDSDSDDEFDEESGSPTPRCRLPVKAFVVSFAILYFVLIIIIELKDNLQPSLKMFRGSAFVISLYMLLSVDVRGWEEAGLGPAFRRMFFNDANVRTLPRDEILKSASVFGLIWSLGFVLFAVTANINQIFFLVWSLIVWSCLIVYGLFVCKCSKLTLPQRSSRLWFIRVLFRVVTAPLWEVEFADFWLADQLCSLTQTMMDLEFSICYLFVDYQHPELGVCDCPKPRQECIQPLTMSNYIRPIVACLPSYWRFAQCLRISVRKRSLAQLINAGKYFSQFPVVVFSSLAGLANISGNSEMYKIYMSLWIVSSIGHSLYVFVWDVVQDWGLCRSLRFGNWILSRRLYYRGEWKYYCAIVVDFFLRFSWSAKLSIQFGVLQSDSNDLIVAILAMLEVFRRFIWNFFRIENEYAQRRRSRALLDSSDHSDS